ncbi:MAG: hypothetical protein ABIF88_02620 [archaeon]
MACGNCDGGNCGREGSYEFGRVNNGYDIFSGSEGYNSRKDFGYGGLR